MQILIEMCSARTQGSYQSSNKITSNQFNQFNDVFLHILKSIRITWDGRKSVLAFVCLPISLLFNSWYFWYYWVIIRTHNNGIDMEIWIGTIGEGKGAKLPSIYKTPKLSNCLWRIQIQFYICTFQKKKKKEVYNVGPGNGLVRWTVNGLDCCWTALIIYILYLFRILCRLMLQASLFRL